MERSPERQWRLVVRRWLPWEDYDSASESDRLRLRAEAMFLMRVESGAIARAVWCGGEK